MNAYNIYTPSDHSERCNCFDFVQVARKPENCLCSHRQRQPRNENKNKLIDSICVGDKQSRSIPLHNEFSQSDMLLVKEMQLKTQQMAQLMSKSKSNTLSDGNNFVSPDLSISSSYSTANDSSDDYFFSGSFDDDEIDEALDSSRSALDFDREFEPSVDGIDNNNRVDSISYKAREDDDDAIFYFEP